MISSADKMKVNTLVVIMISGLLQSVRLFSEISHGNSFMYEMYEIFSMS